MSYSTYYGTTSNSFAGISRPDVTPVASGSLALYNSDTHLADYVASQVPFWVAGTAYATVGQQVLYGNQVWAVVASSTGVTPGTDPTKWALLGSGGGGAGTYLPLSGGTMTGHISLYGTATGVQAISYAQVASMVKGAVAQVGYYHTDTSLITNPVAGRFTWNNATQASSTILYVNIVDSDNTDFYVFYDLIAVNDTFLIQDKDNSDNYQLWKITAVPTFASDVFTFNVTLISSGGTGTTNFPNNHDIFIYTERAAVPSTTDELTEGTINLYFTTGRVLGTALTGFAASTNTSIVDTDTVLQAFQKTQAQITDRLVTTNNLSDLTSASTARTNLGLVKGASSNQIIKGNASGSYADITSTYTVALTDANSYLRIGSGTFTITIPADTLGAALESNSQIMIPWRKIGSGTTTFSVSGAGATLTILGGGTLGTALTRAAGVIVVESTTVATITGTL